MNIISVQLVYESSVDESGIRWFWIESPDMPELMIGYMSIEKALAALVPCVRVLLGNNRRVATSEYPFDPEELLRTNKSTLMLAIVDSAHVSMPTHLGDFLLTPGGTMHFVPVDQRDGTKYVHKKIFAKTSELLRLEGIQAEVPEQYR